MCTYKQHFWIYRLQVKLNTVYSDLYSETGVQGTVLVNGKNRSNNSQTFRTMSAYIHQDAEQRNYLTVGEAMTVAAHLKLGYVVSKEYKQSVVSWIWEYT